MPFQQSFAAAEFSKYFLFLHGFAVPWASLRVSRYVSFPPGKKYPLEALEVPRKRAYRPGQTGSTWGVFLQFSNAGGGSISCRQWQDESA